MRFLERMRRAITVIVAATPFASLLRKVQGLGHRAAENRIPPPRPPLVRIEPKRLADRPVQPE
jgi:hypothetical protein